MRNTKNLKVILLGTIIGIVGITIAYAALSSTLDISVSRITQNALTWNVGFTGSSATATAGGTSSTGRVCGTASITATSVTVANTTLSKPDDSCTYMLNIKNNGTISATINSITAINPTGTTCDMSEGGALMVCGNITYILASNTTGTELSVGTTLASGASQNVYLIVKYTGTSLNSSAVTQNGASFAVVYEQS